MKRLMFLVSLMGLLFGQTAMACPANCVCDASGKVISTNTNTNVLNSGNTLSTTYRNTYNNTNSNNTDNSVHQTTSATAAVDAATGNVTNITQAYRMPRSPVTTAYAAALTSGLDSCLGSMSGGAQTAPVGISIAGTKKDENCIFIKRAHLIAEISPRAECFFIRAHDEEIDRAYKAAGIDCPVDVSPTVVAEVSTSYVTKDDLREFERRVFTRAVGK